MPVYLLPDEFIFPAPSLAHASGLLAVGGDLNPERLLRAYKMGIFPWFSEDEPILWWSPDPRLVLYPQEFHISHSLGKIIRQQRFEVTLDTAFEDVIRACSQTRRKKEEEGTWIGKAMIEAYIRLHAAGFAHSVEACCQGRLVGGLYGLSLGRCFFGESMFSHIDNASKVALAALVEHLKTLAFSLIDCQVTTSHLMRFGAREIPRRRFLRQLAEALDATTIQGKWRFF